MASEQWIGVLIFVIGLYFVICSTMKRDFFLYDLTAKRAAKEIGETLEHRFNRK